MERDAQLAERLDAFVVRFGRMQDTIGDKLIPELRRQMLETPGSALDNLNRMERLGLLPSLLDWVEARNLRNRLIHEYLRDAEDFAGALTRARDLVPLLIETYNRIVGYCRQHLASSRPDWPPALPPIAQERRTSGGKAKRIPPSRAGSRGSEAGWCRPPPPCCTSVEESRIAVT
ncbi:hypothetical protein [Thioflavicoccus mobilis]|uniref:hypothetical protein n=1 Tax=Thioflavicoccus mobilis TaxID=80679 RepID=UPI001FE0BA94|nr:hypothetical protein [Thioflavicoccus mobilis]